MKCSAGHFDGSIVIPGDVLTKNILEIVDKNERVKLGPGLRQDNGEVIACKSGIVRHKNPNLFWVESRQKRYIPVRGENVIGVIVGKMGDAYKVEIGSSEQAILSVLAFEGASKRNHPNLVNGDVIFGKVIVANKDMEPEISCVDQNSGKANGMGGIPSGGFLLTTSLNLVRKILSRECILLPKLGSLFAFEVIVGLNGKIHINTSNQNHTIAIMNMVVEAEHMTNEQILESLSKTEADFK